MLDAPALAHLSHKRLMATFHVEAQRGEQDLYRCITFSPLGASISNFGELIVRGESPIPGAYFVSLTARVPVMQRVFSLAGRTIAASLPLTFLSLHVTACRRQTKSQTVCTFQNVRHFGIGSKGKLFAGRTM